MRELHGAQMLSRAYDRSPVTLPLSLQTLHYTLPGDPPPAVIVLSFAPVVEMTDVAQKHLRCFAEMQGGRCSEPECAGFATRASDDGTMMEDRHGGILHHYGVSEISARNLVLGALRDGVPRALNLSECVFVAQMFNDAVHPRRGSAQMLFACHRLGSAATAAIRARLQIAARAWPA